MIRALRLFAIGLLFCNPLATPRPAMAEDAAAQIIHLISGTWPDMTLTIDPVVVVGESAIAGWTNTQGQGGRALLRRTDGHWQIVLCSGAALKQADVLRQAGLAPEVAKDLADRLAAAEARRPPGRIARLDSFEGTVVMDPATPAHGGHHH